MRPRHVPQRTCVSCRQTGAKRGLLRLVRTPQGAVCLDETGKLAGRGAYLCRNGTCLEKAVTQRKLGRALGVAVDDEVIAALRRHVEESGGKSENG